MSQYLEERINREREYYDDEILERETINRLLSHSNNLLHKQILEDAKKYMSPQGDNGNILEIGCHDWKDWIVKQDIQPSKLECINISATELETGKALYEADSIMPNFQLMDAHELRFDDNEFDVVFGSGILHHLELDLALPEILRVLKPGGVILFAEPMDINPFSKVIRFLTPKARTDDEQAFQRSHFNTVKKYFDLEIKTYQLLSVPAGVLSSYLFRDEHNLLMKVANNMDMLFKKIVPPAKFFYRYSLIIGHKK